MLIIPQFKAPSRIHPADAVTALRLILIPALIACELSSFRISAAVIFFVMMLSDLIDGAVSRLFYMKSAWGALFDLLADFSVILVAYALLYVKGEIHYLPALIVFASCLVYSVIAYFSGRIVFSRIGKYAGAVCYMGIACYFFARVFLSRNSALFLLVMSVIVSAYLIVSMIETIVLFLKTRR